MAGQEGIGEDDFFGALNDLLADEAEEVEQKVADQDNGVESDSEPEDLVETKSEEQAEPEEKSEKEEENLGIRFKKAKDKAEKLENEIASLKAQLKEQQEEKENEEEFMTDEEKKNSHRDKEIESLKSEINNLKTSKQKEANKAIQDAFYESHPELAKDRVAYSAKIEKYLKEHTGLASDVIAGKIGLEQVHIVMGGKPRSVTSDPTKVFGTTGQEPSNPRLAPKEKSSYEKAMDVLSNIDDVSLDDFKTAQNDAILGVTDLFFNS